MRIRTAGHNVLVVHDESKWCATALPDMTVVYGRPHRDDLYLARALQHGYGWAPDPAWQLRYEHEALHSCLAAEMGLPDSLTLRDVRRGMALEYVGRDAVPEYQWLEEGRVLDLALYLNTGDESRHLHNELPALSWELDLRDFRRRALPFLRSPDTFMVWEDTEPLLRAA